MSASTSDRRTTALNAFFESYHRLRPVNATFTGVHAHDDRLPDWSPEGLSAAREEMGELRRVLADAGLGILDDADLASRDWPAIDGALADAFLEVQLAELDTGHFQRGNPSLAIGEALFGVIGLMIRPFAPIEQRALSAAARLRAFPLFFDGVRRTLGNRAIPDLWRERALRECDGGRILLASFSRWTAGETLPDALRSDLDRARVVAGEALEWFRSFVTGLTSAPLERCAVGAVFIDLLVRRGHWHDVAAERLRHEAREAFDVETARLNEAIAALGLRSWSEAAERMAADHPDATGLLKALDDTWHRARGAALAHDLVTWPDYPLQYVPLPPFTRDAAPFLYYLSYRSPAPFDRLTPVDYVVPEPDAAPDEAGRETLLRSWNRSAITLNHVVHHGGLGHHVQNWHAYRAPSRVGQVAAVDCASRIGVFSAGTIAEGWACYATGLMEEVGFLTPLERLSEQHSRVRFLARAIVDLELHSGRLDVEDAAGFYVLRAGLSSAAARSEVTKNSMFPGTALMYWLGTREILRMRDAERTEHGMAHSLKAFHDELLGFGSIPVALSARLMAAARTSAAARQAEAS